MEETKRRKKGEGEKIREAKQPARVATLGGRHAELLIKEGRVL
jgi:hypothetical protein